ncbi:RtcB family protein [Bacillus sp. FJAT-22090]|uniref:RtcB family protein n=1 Tax=Bacillus sp. FJAT-22090 TaxID=1581038 RepID=UPI0011A0C3E8|nr:RtcB family protein [Bacillus sp. FJAT-22090]
MIEIKGTHNNALVFTNTIEETAKRQVEELCSLSFLQDTKIRMMPDLHAGKGCTVGTTMTITDKVVPNFVGVDLGCGMICAKLDVEKEDINFEKLDKTIKKNVPSGTRIRNKEHRNVIEIPFAEVTAPINENRARLSLGTLGGGNHFIELNVGNDGSIYLVIHSGSRNLGKQIAEHYQQVAHQSLGDSVPKELAYVEGESMKDYLYDLSIAQKYAAFNRKTMVDVICRGMNWKIKSEFDTIHNYIDLDNMILRKGAISAQDGEIVIIPMNMRDGSLICRGKGNPDWNYSGPHGAGRIMSRSQARKLVNLEDFQNSMKDVWSTSVVASTVDESPFAYKDMQDILAHIEDTVDVLEVIKPLYNYKAH